MARSTERILTTHVDSLHRLANKLLEVETLDAETIKELLSDVPKWEASANGAARIQAPRVTGGTPSDGIAAAQSNERGRD